MLFGQLVTAMCTPFTEERAIDWAGVNACIEQLIETKSDAIVVSGTTAESPTLTHEEKLALFSFVTEKVAGRVKVIAGTGSNHTDGTIELTKEAEKLGVDGIMLVVPYYNKPSQEGLYQHFRAVASETSLPIMLYNIPGRTGVNMTVETMVRLSTVDNIVAFKEASGDLNQISELISKLDPEICVYSGDDALTLPILAVGGVGVVSVASHLVGKDIKEMIESYVRGDVKRATLLHQQLLPMFSGLFISSNPVPLKYLMSQKGWCTSTVRLPLTELSDDQQAQIAHLVKK